MVSCTLMSVIELTVNLLYNTDKYYRLCNTEYAINKVICSCTREKEEKSGKENCSDSSQ